MSRPPFNPALYAGVLCLLAGSASADTYTPQMADTFDDGDLHYNPFEGSYRLVYGHLNRFALDADRTVNPLRDLLDHRLRYAPSMTWRGLHLRLELDLLDGQIAGDHEDLAQGWRRFDRRDADLGRQPGNPVRQACIQWRSPLGLLKAGQTTSSYGLGIVANAGIDDPDRFGVARHGDIVERVMLATTPFLPLAGKGTWGEYLSFVLAADAVYRDDNARLEEGDRAWQFTGGVAWRHPRATQAFFASRRVQRDVDGDALDVTALSANGRFVVALNLGGGDDGERDEDADPPVASELRLAYEVAGLLGHTDRYINFGAPSGLDVRALGAVARLTWAFPAPGVEVELEGGYASGDGDQNDGRATAFSFDPDYKVGLIFFDEVLPLVTARSVEQATDPARVAVPVKGAELAMSQGRVTNARYLFPQVRWRAAGRLQLVAGVLFLSSDVPFAQAYYTFENGGVAANHLRAPTTSSYLGTELLGGLRARFEGRPGHLVPTFRLEGGAFVPGRSLEDRAGALPAAIWKAVATGQLEWR